MDGNKGSSAPAPRGHLGFYLGLTLVIIIIVIMVSKSFATAVLIITLLANFVIISTYLTLMHDRVAGQSGSPAPGPYGSSGPPDRFTTATTAPPGAGAPEVVAVAGGRRRGSAGESYSDFGGDTGGDAGYPGAIDGGIDDDSLPQFGATDWRAEGRDNVPAGNPFSTSRTASPQAAPPDVDDDAVAALDGDELMAVQGRSRNDPTRVWAGALRKKAQLSRYVKEELDERENSRWWGQHEV